MYSALDVTVIFCTFYTDEGDPSDDLDALICMLDAEAGFFSSLEGELPAMSEANGIRTRCSRMKAICVLTVRSMPPSSTLEVPSNREWGDAFQPRLHHTLHRCPAGLATCIE